MSEAPDYDYDEADHDCPNCGGEGFASSCFEEWACIDSDGGCDDCMRRCDWCSSSPTNERPETKEGDGR